MIEKDKRLYSALKNLDAQTRKNYENDKISDKEYFRQGIIFDLASNLLALMLCHEYRCLNSPGVDLNCRAILESLTLLKKFENDEFDDWNYFLYRYSYLAIEPNNDKNAYKDALKNNIPGIADVEEKRAEYLKKLKEHYNIKSKDSKNFEKQASSSDFYIRKKWNVPPSFENDIKQWSEEVSRDYDVFNYYVHINSVHKELKDDLDEIRINSVYRCFKLGVQELRERNLLTPCKRLSFDFDKEKHETKQCLLVADKVFGLMSSLVYIFANGAKTNEMTDYLNAQLDILLLYKDIQICRSFGFNEQAILKFKIFSEKASFLYAMCKLELSRRPSIVSSFKLYCDTEVAKVINKNVGSAYYDIKSFEDELKKEYENNWRAKFANYSDFKKACKGARGLIDEEDSTDIGISSFVREHSVDWLGSYASRFDSVYSISLDMGHSCGYSLNSSDKIWDFQSLNVTVLMDAYFLNTIDQCKGKQGLNTEEQKYFDSYISTLPEQFKLDISTMIGYSTKLFKLETADFAFIQKQKTKLI